METLTIPASVRLVEGDFIKYSGIRRVVFLGGPCNIHKDAFGFYCGEIYAPHTPVGCFGSSGAKWEAAWSFAKAFLDGTELDPNVKTGYLDYIRRFRKDFYQAALKEEGLMQLMVQEKMIPRETVQELLDQCAKEGRNAVMALLLEYSKTFPPLDPVKEAEKGFRAMEREAKALETCQETGYMTAAMAKLLWKYSQLNRKKPALILEKWKGEDSEVVTPKGIARKEVREIGDYAFTHSKVQRITVSEGVQVIHRYAFSWCGQLTSISLPDSVKEMEEGVFVDCVKLTSVPLPKKLKEINASLFAGCSRLTEIVIPGKVKTIGSNAFSCCENLESVVIPASVEEIDKWAFSNCPKLTIHAPAGSYAEQYARENGIRCVTEE